MLRSWGCLIGVLCGVAWSQTPVPVDSTPTEIPADSARRHPWCDAPVDVHCVTAPADRALRELAESLGVPVCLSPETEAALAARRVTFHADGLAAGQAARWLARLGGTRAVCCDDGIYVTAPSDESVAWGMLCRSLGTGAEESASPSVPEPVAAIELVNGTASAGVRTLAEAFGVNVAAFPGVRDCQRLVTLHSPAITLAEACKVFCNDTGLTSLRVDGLLAFGTRPELESLGLAVSAPATLEEKAPGSVDTADRPIEALVWAESSPGARRSRDVVEALRLRQSLGPGGPIEKAQD
jgi:hypothetical protein